MPEPERTRLKFALYAVAGAILLFAAAWFARMEIAEFAAETWLASRGVPARVEISRLDFGGVEASIRLGKPDAPDLSADRISLAFAPHGWFEPKSLHVQRAFLRVHFDGKQLTFGQLQKLVEELTQPQSTALPSTSQAEAPSRARKNSALAINIDNALVQVDAPQGSMKIFGHVVLQGSELAALTAKIEPASLRGANFRADMRGGSINATQTADGLDLRAILTGSARTAKLDFENAQMTFDVNGLRWTKTADGLRVTGKADAQISAASAAFGEYAMNNLHAVANASGSAATDMLLDMDLASSATGDVADETVRKLADKVPSTEAKTRRAIKAALQSVSADIAAHLTRENGRTTLTLARPASFTGKNGAVLSIAPGARALLIADESGINGAANATLKGRGLPNISLGVPAYSMHKDGSFTAETALDARFSALGLRGAHIVSNGVIARMNDAIFYRPNDCARIAVAAVTQKGKTSLERLRARLCPVPEKILLTLAKTGWSVNARLRSTSADMASAQTAVSNAAIGLQIASDKAGEMNGTVHIASADVHDLASSPRFKPLSASGNLTLAHNAVNGKIALANGKEKLASIALSHSLKSGKGHADIESRALDFKPGGFQPADISPLLAQLARAQGSAQFTGRIAWTKRGMTSQGELDVDGFDFNTPLGAATGASTHVIFTSLVPLRTAPDQKVSISRIGWVTPLTDASAEFEIDPGTLHVMQAGTDIAKGRLTLDAMTVPFASGEAFNGAVRLSNVDLGMIVAASNLADKISIKARIEGAVPFSVGPQGVRLTDGSVQSLAPGELSIKRSLWTSGDESGGKSNAIRDFAFQALEHLAVEKMSGQVESLPKGRLRVVLHIKGYNNPPVPVETRVDVFSLWNGTAFDKPLPLPAKTPVDLTLDTSLNFDELLRAYRSAWQTGTGQADTMGTKP